MYTHGMQVTDHARQLMEKHMRKPFFDGGYAGSVPRMNAQDLEEGIAWVDDRFFPIRYEDEALPSVDWVLNVAKAAVLRCTSLSSGTCCLSYTCLSVRPPAMLSVTSHGVCCIVKITDESADNKLCSTQCNGVYIVRLSQQACSLEASSNLISIA